MWVLEEKTIIASVDAVPKFGSPEDRRDPLSSSPPTKLPYMFTIAVEVPPASGIRDTPPDNNFAKTPESLELKGVKFPDSPEATAFTKTI